MIDFDAVNSASKKLELRDIVLHTSSLVRDENAEPCLYPFSVKQQPEVKAVTHTLEFLDEDDEEFFVLRAHVRLEVAGFKQEQPDTPLFTIRAEYRIDYLRREEMTLQEIEAFSAYNAVHNVWPFWRQYVHQTVGQAQLPRLTIPFFRRSPDAERAVRTARKTPAKIVQKTS